ncbi:DapH/DapD/GlmU-related protein [Sporofaciens sp. SGI.106]|uniref:DapH/DapD/GlmU-related protein n=1 Tax=Sporofaciens sp. SGI.106 TaxID=3420568 RepID=UPI002A9A883B|nr:DapH/DapD/GlmU-related protein [Lachnoclostridium sp.]
MQQFNALPPEDMDGRAALLPEIFGEVGENVWIVPPLSAAVGKYVSIGEGTYANMNLTLIDDWKITIGKNVLIGPNVTLSTTGHPIHPAHRADGMYSFPVTIGDNVWIGANVIVLPGVTIGENSVIGAGSVVTKYIPANVVAFGVPCKVYREINEHDKEYYFRDRRFDEQPAD